MKNANLLRLASFGFFGAAFLSPAPEQNEGGWLPEKMGIAREIASIPFTMSALHNYRKTTITDSDQDTANILQPFYKSSLNTPPSTPENAAAQSETTPDKSTPANLHKRTETIAAAEIKATDNELNEAISAPLPQEPGKVIEENSSLNNSHLPAYLPGEKDNEEEKILPPVDYVDEVITSKKQRAENVFGSTLVPIITMEPEAGLNTYPEDLMQARIKELSDYANENNYSTEYAFIINLGLKSGRKRFFLVDLLHETIVKSGLVAHGRGKEKFTLHKRYSNMPGSACSSLGLYKVGSAYRGGFGKSFRLVGLEKTNSNAFSRAIVLHAMGCIPNEEIPYPICQSEGCPSLSPEFLEEISPVIQKSEKPMLLWIFDPVINHDRIL